MVLSADDKKLNAAKHLALYLKLAAIEQSTLVKAYSYADMRRLLVIASGGTTVKPVAVDVDPLAKHMVAGLRKLPRVDDAPFVPEASLAVLFQPEPEAKALKPKLYIGYDLSVALAPVCSMLTTCEWVADEALSTQLFDRDYCIDNDLPPFTASWTLIDGVSALRKKGVRPGRLLVVTAMVTALRAKRSGVVSIAVSDAAKEMFQALGFRTHEFQDRDAKGRPLGAKRTLCYMTKPLMNKVHAQLKATDSLISTICWRNGLTPRTASTLIGRC